MVAPITVLLTTTKSQTVTSQTSVRTETSQTDCDGVGTCRFPLPHQILYSTNRLSSHLPSGNMLYWRRWLHRLLFCVRHLQLLGIWMQQKLTLVLARAVRHEPHASPITPPPLFPVILILAAASRGQYCPPQLYIVPVSEAVPLQTGET